VLQVAWQYTNSSTACRTPEGVIDGWALWELGQLLADAGGEQAKQALATECADGDVAGDGPAANIQSSHSKHSRQDTSVVVHAMHHQVSAQASIVKLH
jgi:hypothetical protein